MRYASRICAVCGTGIRGRSDKRFCSQSCKNKFHSKAKSDQPAIVKQINQMLYKNHKIIAAVFAGESKQKLKVPRILLEKMGFYFNYHTGIYRNNQGKLYHYIYDYAWMTFSDAEILLVKKKAKPF